MAGTLGPSSAGLLQALGIRRGDVVAVAGAGGKTTLVYGLAAEAHAAGWRVLVTTTTHMGGLPGADTGPVFVEAEDPDGPGLLEALRREGRATLLGRRVRADKLEGVKPERVDALRREADLVVVEADGARGRSLKAPAPHEPVLPASTTFFLVLAALDVLGRPLSAEHVHRLEQVLVASGRAAGDVIDEAVMARVLGDPEGYRARVTPGARSGVFLNKVEDESRMEAAARLAASLRPPYDLVAAGSARTRSLRVWR